MRKSALYLSSALASGIISTTQVGAATMTFESIVPGPYPISAPAQVIGEFDLSDFVVNLNDAGLEPVVTSAAVSLFGYSSANNSYTVIDTGTFTYYVRNSYSHRHCSWCSRHSHSYYTQATGTSTTAETGDHEVDTVLVDFGETELSDDTSNPGYTYSSGSYYYGTRTIYEVGRDYGSVSDTEALQMEDFNQLLDGFHLDYVLDVTTGSFDSLQVNLVIDYDTRELPPAVPLPASGLLLVGGLSGLALYRRRRLSQ